MATRRAIDMEHRLRNARRSAEKAVTLIDWGGTATDAYHAVKALERAAIAVGEERERGRQAKRKGPRR